MSNKNEKSVYSALTSLLSSKGRTLKSFFRSGVQSLRENEAAYEAAKIFEGMGKTVKRVVKSGYKDFVENKEAYQLASVLERTGKYAAGMFKSGQNVIAGAFVSVPEQGLSPAYVAGMSKGQQM